MGQVIRGEFDEDAVAGEYADEIHTDLTGNMGSTIVPSTSIASSFGVAVAASRASFLRRRSGLPPPRR
jgi:hypothetical protein